MSKSTIKNKSKIPTDINSTTIGDNNKLVEVDINKELEKNEIDIEDDDVADSEPEENIENDENDDNTGLDNANENIEEGESEVDENELSEVDENELSEVDEDDATDIDEEESEVDNDDDDDEGINKKSSKGNKNTKKTSKTKGKVKNISGIEMLKTTKKTAPITIDDDADDSDEYEDDDMNELYLQKFDSEMRENYILENHAESKSHNYEEVKALSRVVRDGRGIIVDPLHKTNPILTKYEMTCILGQRAKQLDSGAKAFVKVPLNVIDGYFIAMIELEQKKIPFIIKRPLPNGGVEYWNVSDLEILI